MKRNSLTKMVSCGILVFAAALPGIAVAADAPATKAQTPTPAVKTEVLAEIPQSVFVIPASAQEGRNPFFPRSRVVVPEPKVVKADPFDINNFVLNGITSPPRATAMINGRTFGQGEAADVKLGNGAKVSIQCAEIRTDAAVIVVGGQRRELRLRGGL